MKTWTGSDAPLTSGEPNILDIVMHLGREPRWGGFGDQDYKVLHHSFLCALIHLKAGYPPEEACYPLLHDGHEYLTGDIPSPVKVLMGPGVKVLEKDIDRRLLKSVNVPELSSGSAYGELVARRVRVCDFVALVIEAPLFGPPGASDPCEHSASVNNLPEEYRAEVAAVLARVLPDFERIREARRG